MMKIVARPSKKWIIAISLLCSGVLVAGILIAVLMYRTPQQPTQKAEAKKASSSQAAAYNMATGVPLREVLKNCVLEATNTYNLTRAGNTGPVPDYVQRQFDDKIKYCNEKYGE